MVESRLLQTQPAAPPSPPEPAVRARSILVIEDEPPIRRAIRNALRGLAERVVEAGAGGGGDHLAPPQRPAPLGLHLRPPHPPGPPGRPQISPRANKPVLGPFPPHAA